MRALASAARPWGLRFKRCGGFGKFLSTFGIDAARDERSVFRGFCKASQCLAMFGNDAESARRSAYLTVINDATKRAGHITQIATQGQKDHFADQLRAVGSGG